MRPLHDGASLARSWALAGAALAYGLFSVVQTWPVARYPRSVLWGDHGDTRGWAWLIWARTHASDRPPGDWLAAPFGSTAQGAIAQPIADWTTLLLGRAANEIAAIGWFDMLAFAGTALATYVVLHRLLRDGPAAFIGGLAFGFCPAAVMHAVAGHGGTSLNAFVALFLLALFHNRAERSIRSAALVALSYAAIVFTSIYTGYYALYLGVYFAAFDYLTQRRAHAKQLVRNYALVGAIAALVVVPVLFASIQSQLVSSTASLAKSGRIRDFGQLAIYSSRPWDYVLPPIDHPVLGSLVESFARSHLHGSNLFEQTLYLGIVPIALFVAGAFMALRGSLEGSYRDCFMFFALGALWMYFVSLPPTIGGSAPTISWFAYEIAPMFRVYARAGILVSLLVAGAAAAVLAQVGRHMSPRRYRALVAALACVAVVDYWSTPALHARAVEPAPDVYQWLAGEAGDAIVAEYPMMRFDEASFYTYPFWQRVHRKRLVNGATPEDAPAWAFFERVKDLGNAETPRLLKTAAVKYVIVHASMYQEGPIPAPLKRYYPPERSSLTFEGGAPPAIPPGLHLYKSFPDALVYTLTD